ncbi:MAG: hypothetical protein JST12_14125 [Armatimonadetes bacterium]|nr:hypothetical protein [Armatimonadota bacterium]MBS1702797.1 hypothetical protein [Armatimonadota bacterium]MBS1729068.1 hypothetical protein [Armatimonadota bacterium]
MPKPISIKPEEAVARSYADRLILEKLSEMEAAVKLGELADKLSDAGIGLAAVRSLMASNPDVFAYHERRWVPAARLNSQGRPIAEIVRAILDSFGAPVAFTTLVEEVARAQRTTPEAIEPMIRRLVNGHQGFIEVEGALVAQLSWGFVAKDEPLARALALNGVSVETLEATTKKLAGVDFRAEGWATEVLKHAPLNIKAIGAVAYSKVNSDDPRSALIFDAESFYRALFAVPGYIYNSDGTFMTEADAKSLVSAALKLAQKLTPSIDVDDAAPLEFKPEDVDRLIKKIVSSEKTVTAIRLLEEFFEITPGSKTFPDDLANIIATLCTSDKVEWVGGDRFRKAGDHPEYIMEVPEPFQFVPSGVLNEEGEEVDLELTDDGLNSSLRKLLQHPLALDVLDEDIQPALKNQPESIRMVLKSIHRELGTFPLAQVPTGWLDDQPKIQEAMFVDPTGRELQVWINQEARLMYGLIDWWLDQPIESGAVFTLTKTPSPNVFEFEYLDQPDPVVYISSQRMEELRTLGAESEGKSTLDVLIDVMNHWPKGADYLTILAEINVARRTSRRLVASLLSSYQCFYQRSGSPVWHFDAKKVDQGFDKSKKKFVKK